MPFLVALILTVLILFDMVELPIMIIWGYFVVSLFMF